MRRGFSKFVPRLLIAYQMERRVQIFQELENWTVNYPYFV